MKLAIVLMIFSLMPLPIQGPTKDLYVDYDKALDATYIRIDDDCFAINVGGAGFVSFTPSFVFDGRIRKGRIKPIITVAVQSELVSKNDITLKLSLVVDENSIGPYEIYRNLTLPSKDGPAYFYTFSAKNPAEFNVISSIAKAKKVTGKIGRVQFELPPSVIEHFQQLDDEIHNPSMQGYPANLNVEYDSSAGHTFVRIEHRTAINVIGASSLLFGPYGAFKGRVRRGPVTVALALAAHSWLLSENDASLQLKLFIDGKQLGPFTLERAIRRDRGDGELSAYAWICPIEIIEELSKAKKVKGQVGNIVFEVSPLTLVDIRVLNEELQKK